VTGPLLLGAVCGLGVLALAAGLVPRRPRLAAALAAVLHEPVAPPPSGGIGGWVARLGRRAAGPLARLGLPGRRLASDLALLGQPPEALLAVQVTTALTGVLLMPAIAGLLAAEGAPVPWQLPAVGTLALGAAGFALPALITHHEAAARRAAARHALTAFVDLVVLAVAAGAGVEAALSYAAATGHGWAFTQIRGALAAARLTRRPPWHTLGQLGRDLGLAELTELAASLTLAGTEGAKVRASLAAKAAALRTRQLTDAETSAQAATERMSLPLVLLFAGFLILIGYPAVIHVLTGL
jgi:Flp pilus assembly protein TadB